MVKEYIKNKGKEYQCGICKFKYLEKKWAEKCYKWCKKNKSCNLEIIKHAPG